jgi:hypothetical protein
MVRTAAFNGSLYKLDGSTDETPMQHAASPWSSNGKICCETPENRAAQYTCALAARLEVPVDHCVFAQLTLLQQPVVVLQFTLWRRDDEWDWNPDSLNLRQLGTHECCNAFQAHVFDVAGSPSIVTGSLLLTQ